MDAKTPKDPQRYYVWLIDFNYLTGRIDEIRERNGIISAKRAHWMDGVCLSICAPEDQMKSFIEHPPQYVSKVESEDEYYSKNK